MNAPVTEIDGPAAEAESPLKRLSEEQLQALADEFNALGDKTRAELGAQDRRYVEIVYALYRRLAVGGRLLLLAPEVLPARVAGTLALTSAKTLENMELGHNVLHGQWDWMNDPRIHSTTWEWDNASTAEVWKHSHNYVHHTFTNIRGKDLDIGFRVMRVFPEQKWHPIYLLQPLYNLILAAFFEWGVAIHDIDQDAMKKGEKPKAELDREFGEILKKARGQVTKDLIAWPLVSGLVAAAVELGVEAGSTVRGGRRRRRRGGALQRALAKGTRAYKLTAKSNATAVTMRNVWTYATIFCGHFADQIYTFSEEEVEDETPGGWFVRQLYGTANIEGSPLFHLFSGHIGYQIEHHLYPDIPSRRYKELAPKVREICKRYDLPYNTGPFVPQFAAVQRTILKMAFPVGKPQPKPNFMHSEVPVR
jgi:linoleoyl-CoA desaturase